jgi:hypothetical protein
MSDLKHITESELYAFRQELMSQEDKEIFLAHICTCNYCSDLFAEAMSEEMITAPRNMKDNLLRAAKRPEVQLAVKARETSKQMQLFLYSLKVGSATVLALLLLMLTVNFNGSTNISSSSIPNPAVVHEVFDPNDPTLSTRIRDNMNKLGNDILNFSNNIIETKSMFR